MDSASLLLIGLVVYILYQQNDTGLTDVTINSNSTNNNTPVNNGNPFEANNNYKLAQVNATLANKIRQIINIAASQGYVLYIDEAYRTQARQDELYAQGRTTAGNIVTYTKNSKHTQGKAVDVMPVINGQPTNSLTDFNWQLIGTWARQVGGLTWGGNWTNLKDYRHLEI